MIVVRESMVLMVFQLLFFLNRDIKWEREKKKREKERKSKEKKRKEEEK